MTYTGRAWSSSADGAGSHAASGTTASRNGQAQQATIKPSVHVRQVPETCKKPQGNPLTHVCTPKSDFKARKSRAAKREKAKERAKARKTAAGREARLPGVPGQGLPSAAMRGVQDRPEARLSGRIPGRPGIVPRPAQRLGGCRDTGAHRPGRRARLRRVRTRQAGQEAAAGAAGGVTR